MTYFIVTQHKNELRDIYNNGRLKTDFNLLYIHTSHNLGSKIKKESGLPNDCRHHICIKTQSMKRK